MSSKEPPLEEIQQRKFRFPTWRDLFEYTTEAFEEEFPLRGKSLRKHIFQCLKTIDKVRNKLSREGQYMLPDLAHEWVKNARGRYEKGSDMNAVLKAMRSIELGGTEFFTIYDVLKNEHIDVDLRVEEILGISPTKFNVRSLSGFDPEFPLNHPEDIHHFIRIATMAYLVSCLPSFEWKANQDHFRAHLRLGTSCSSIPALREARYVMAEIKIYMSHELAGDEEFLPLFHLDRWTIYDASEFEGIKPYFSSGLRQSMYMNSYLYLLNAYLLDISPKYIILLHERTRHDRYKAIAKSIFDQVQEISGKEIILDETRVANYFSKTIRPKLAAAAHTWDKQPPTFTLDSDQQAVDLAKKLGLLPVPPSLIEMIYKKVAYFND